MKKMRIRIMRDGRTELRVEGAVGAECEEFTKAFEQAVGETVQREYTEAYYRDRVELRDEVDERL